MDEPQRIQRKRTKGWRMPPNTVYVGRGTVWGNPFVIGSQSGIFDGVDGRALGIRDQREILIPSLSREQCISFYLDLMCGCVLPEMYPFGHDWKKAFNAKYHCHPTDAARYALRGKNLACFCQLDQPCHADVLLKLANERPLDG